tara:strand:- start:102 stop:476 length:375 start_codon:yes stop_codon:yes gene_type:complete
MKKFLILIIALLLVACGDSRAKDKELVVDTLLADPDMVVLDFSIEDIECMVDDISDAMDDETWSLYIEYTKLEKAGLSNFEIIQKLDLSMDDQGKIASAALTSLMSFNCLSVERLMEIGLDLDY